MTTPEPRVGVAPVHVTKIAACDTYWGEPAWAAGCRECGEWIAGPRLTWDGAMIDALHHDCPGLRLARLLRELEALRDGFHYTSEQWIDSIAPGSPDLTKGFRMGESCAWTAAGDDLTALIDRATDGGPGC